MLNHGEANMARLKKRLLGLPLLLETNIFGVCRQTYNEGTGVLFKTNTIALIVPLKRISEDIVPWLPKDIDISCIQRLRLEIKVPPSRTSITVQY